MIIMKLEDRFYGFWHRKVFDMTATVCLFCYQTLALSANPDFLSVVEEHHKCEEMQDFLTTAERLRSVNQSPQLWLSE